MRAERGKGWRNQRDTTVRHTDRTSAVELLHVCQILSVVHAHKFRAPDIGESKNVWFALLRQPQRLTLQRRAWSANLERQARYGAAAAPQTSSAGESRERLSPFC